MRPLVGIIEGQIEKARALRRQIAQRERERVRVATRIVPGRQRASSVGAGVDRDGSRRVLDGIRDFLPRGGRESSRINRSGNVSGLTRPQSLLSQPVKAPTKIDW